MFRRFPGVSARLQIAAGIALLLYFGVPFAAASTARTGHLGSQTASDAGAPVSQPLSWESDSLGASTSFLDAHGIGLNADRTEFIATATQGAAPSSGHDYAVSAPNGSGPSFTPSQNASTALPGLLLLHVVVAGALVVAFRKLRRR